MPTRKWSSVPPSSRKGLEELGSKPTKESLKIIPRSRFGIHVNAAECKRPTKFTTFASSRHCRCERLQRPQIVSEVLDHHTSQFCRWLSWVEFIPIIAESRASH